MNPFTNHHGLVLTMDRPNVDTDQIIPKQFLKRIERTGFGKFLFFDWRFREDGSDIPEFELNLPQFKGASVLVARRNFGCGSSREHAPWALEDHGFRVLIAPSFADIFYNNCFKNGMLPIALSEEVVERLFERANAAQGRYELTIDLQKCTVADSQGTIATFEIDPFRQHCLLEGLDDIGMTLQHEDAILRFEQEQGIVTDAAAAN